MWAQNITFNLGSVYGIFSLFFENFLRFWDSKNLIYQIILYFPALTLLSAFLQRVLVPLSREWCLEHKIWILDVLIAIGVLLLSILLSKQN